MNNLPPNQTTEQTNEQIAFQILFKQGMHPEDKEQYAELYHDFIKALKDKDNHDALAALSLVHEKNNDLIEKLEKADERWDDHCEHCFEGEVIRLKKQLADTCKAFNDEKTRLLGDYCTCSMLPHYRLFHEGDFIRHGDCGKFLSPKMQAEIGTSR